MIKKKKEPTNGAIERKNLFLTPVVSLERVPASPPATWEEQGGGGRGKLMEID